MLRVSANTAPFAAVYTPRSATVPNTTAQPVFIRHPLCALALQQQACRPPNSSACSSRDGYLRAESHLSFTLSVQSRLLPPATFLALTTFSEFKISSRRLSRPPEIPFHRSA